MTTHEDLEEQLVRVEDKLVDLSKQQNWIIMVGLTVLLAISGALYRQGTTLAAVGTQLQLISTSQEDFKRELTERRADMVDVMTQLNAGLFDLHSLIEDRSDQNEQSSRDRMRDHKSEDHR